MSFRKKFVIFFSVTLTLVILNVFLLSFVLVATDEKKEDASVRYDEFFIDSALFTHQDDLSVYNQPVISLDEFNLKLENENLALYSNKKTGAIRIRNKLTNYLWCSDVYDIDEENTTNAIRKRITSAFKVAVRNSEGQYNEFYTTDAQVNTTETVSGNSLKVKVYSSKYNIGFTYILTLLSERLDVLIDNESIVEDGSNKINKITLFPYLGSVYEDTIPGYIFFPSGSGALIRYSKTSPITTTFITSFFGTDANLTKNTEDDVLSLPVYGVCQGINQNALFVNIKKGSAFSNLIYSPSNIDLGYNLIYPEFNLRDTYLLSIPGSSDILMVPEDYYHEDIEMTYTFLSGDDANYVGMAKAYQEELVSDKVIVRNDTTKNNISMQIEAFGRDYENGLIFKRFKNMTTTKDILNINNRLASSSIDNIVYVLRAFNRKGYSSQSVSNYKFDSRLGRLSDLKDLEAYFYYNPIESYNSKKSYPSKVLVNSFNEKNYIAIEKEKYKFYSNVSSVLKYTEKAIKYYDNIALDGIGYRLYGDKNNKLARYEVLNKYSELLGDNKLPLFSPNSYLLKNTSIYFNMQLYSARYRFVTDSVPFLEIVLKGYIDYYSPYLNFSSNIDLDVLKCIEYGVNPAFLITEKQSYLLSDTLASNYYATYYESLESIIINKYNYINDALKQVTGATITNRNILEEGISLVTYSNGVKIIVNYTKDAYNYSGTTVDALGYKVI